MATTWLRRSGGRARTDPRPVVYHHHGRKSWRFEGRRLLKTYDIARGALLHEDDTQSAHVARLPTPLAGLDDEAESIRTFRELVGGLRFLVAEFASHQETGVPRS